MSLDSSETPALQRRRDGSFYLVLILAVIPIWGLVPLSWLFVAYGLHAGTFWSFSSIGKLAFLVASVEALFSIHQYRLAHYISRLSPTAPYPPADLQHAFTRVLQVGLADLPENYGDEESLLIRRPGSPAEVIERLAFDDARAIDFRNCLRTWFGKAPWSSIRTEQVYAWIYWTIYNTVYPGMDALGDSTKAVLEDTVELIEKRSGTSFVKGSDPKIKAMLLTIDPVSVTLRPLAWYVLVKAGNVALRAWYRNYYGFNYGRHRDLEYLIRIPKGHSKFKRDPCIFIHGLGLGLLQYQRAIRNLVEQLPDQPLLVLVQPHISQDIFHSRFLRPLSRSETVDYLHGLIHELGWAGNNKQGVTVLSHSNGSYAHAWLLKAHPALVTRSCFADPVTFCSWEGDVCNNFVYKKCTTGVALLMRYFVGTELGVANLIQRHYDWSGNALWYEEIPDACDPSRTMFVLGGNDEVVEAKRVKKYLNSHGVNEGLWFDPVGRHGQALLAGGGLTEVIRWLRKSPRLASLDTS